MKKPVFFKAEFWMAAQIVCHKRVAAGTYRQANIRSWIFSTGCKIQNNLPKAV